MRQHRRSPRSRRFSLFWFISNRLNVLQPLAWASFLWTSILVPWHPACLSLPGCFSFFGGRADDVHRRQVFLLGGGGTARRSFLVIRAAIHDFLDGRGKAESEEQGISGVPGARQP